MEKNTFNEEDVTKRPHHAIASSVLNRDSECLILDEVETDVGDEVEKDVDDEVEEDIDDGVETGVGDEVETGVGDEVETGVGDEVETDVGDEVEKDVDDEVEEDIDDGVETDEYDEVETGVGDEVEKDVGDEVEKDVYEVETDASLAEEIINGKPSQILFYTHQQDSGRSSPDDTEEEPAKERRSDSRPIQWKPVNQERLKELWVKAKDNEEDKMKVFELCNDICSYIVNKHSNEVLSVWPAYESNDSSSIVFVLNTKELTNEKDLGLEYSTVVRPINTYSDEATRVMNSEENKEHELSFTESENIRQAINNKAKELMQCHKNLSVISGSGVRSRNFKQGKHEIFPQPCVVLYVHTKGIIPLDENEFPNSLDGIPVDVREGEFHTCVSAKEYQHTLQMGCQIESGKMGTLGGFVDHPEYGLSAITCAHVVLDDEELHDLRMLRRNSKKIWRNNEKPVYQPDRGDEVRNHCGLVKEALYKAGTGDKSGVDLAIFQIDKRAPDSGTFPDVSNTPTDMVFETGKLCSSVNENYNHVMKFGCTTDKTEGFVQFSNSAVRLIEFKGRYRVSSNDYTYSLFNQFEIRPLQQQFVQPGDSGSLVFKKDVSGDLLCIGMVVGVLEPIGNGIVIPISAIKSELGVSELKNFSWNVFRRIDLRLSNMDLRLSRIEDSLRKLANK